MNSLCIHRYAASIEKIDYEDEKVLIHYRQWSHRYDEWFDWSSPYLRPVERIQLRKQGLNERQSAPVSTSCQTVLNHSESAWEKLHSDM